MNYKPKYLKPAFLYTYKGNKTGSPRDSDSPICMVDNLHNV